MAALQPSEQAALPQLRDASVAGGSGIRYPSSPSSAGSSSPPTAGLAPTFYYRSRAVGLALPVMAALSGHDGVGQAGHRRPMAPIGLPLVLALAFEIRTA